MISGKKNILRKEKEDKFKMILESAPDAIVIVGEDGVIQLVNAQTEKLFGYNRNEIIGKKVEMLMPERYQASHLGHRNNFFVNPRVRGMGEGMVLFGKRKDGTEFSIEISLSPLATEEGNLVSAAIRDVTDRKKAEEKFRSLLDSAPDATVIVNKSGIIEMANQQTENLFGYSRNEIIGKPVEILVPGELREKHIQHRTSFVKGAKVRVIGAGIELNAVKKNGERFPVEISLSPLQTDEGILISASVRDITERKKLENELRKSNAEIEAFTYSVSHDLRAPLRGIIGFTAVLEEEYASKLDNEAKRITSIIKENTLKMGQLIDDLLAFSRMGKEELIKTMVNSKALVAEIIDEQNSQSRNTNPIHWTILSLSPVNADIITIRQVWINLISNAVKYSAKREQPVIEIGSYFENGYTIFYVKDNGVGFDNQYKHKLFKVFQRLHDDEEFEGTGIGLALVEKIISRHGGKVWADGKEGQGACFYFSLPLQ